MAQVNYLPVGDNAARQIINSTSVLDAYLAAMKASQRYAGGMYWKRQGEYEYLVKTGLANEQQRLGARSRETEAAYTSFTQGKQSADERFAALGAALKEAQRLNKALRAGRVPGIVVDILQRLQSAGLQPHFTVVGTHALYAYEAAAGVRIVESALATQDVDMLWDARKRVQFVTDLARTEAGSMLRLLQQVDRSFQRKEEQAETAVNDRGFEVDFLRRMQEQDDPHPFRFSNDEDDLWPVQARRAGMLTQAPPFRYPVIATDGSMAMMNTIAPTAFVEFKLWLASSAPNRPELKRRRDRSQAEIVQAMLDAGILIDEQGLPSEDERSNARSEAEILALLSGRGLGAPSRTGVMDMAYVGPIIAVTERHVAQDTGRGRVVLHDTRTLDRLPAVGETVEVRFEDGRARVTAQTVPVPVMRR